MSTNNVALTEILAGCIEIYDNVIDNYEQIIDIVENKNQWNSATIYSSDGSCLKVNENIRSNKVYNVDQFSYYADPILFETCRLVWRYCVDYSEKYLFNFSSTESAQVLKYSPGEYYESHHDDGPQLNRIFSALLYLNDVEEGGETHFINFDIKIKPKAGRLVIFPSNYAYEHAALPPKNQNKYVMTFWMKSF